MSKIEISEPNNPKHFYRVIRGTKYLYTLMDDEKWAYVEEGVLVISPTRPPKIILADGSIKEIKIA